VVFDAPIETVYRLLSQSARQVEYRPELSSVEIVEVRSDGSVDEHHLRILFQGYVYRIAYQMDPKQRRIEWRLDERFENDLDRVVGFWELHPMQDGRTLGRSGTSVDVGTHVPGFVQDWITRKNLPTTMEHVRRWVNSGGTYRP
jgi:hypothetical protein